MKSFCSSSCSTAIATALTLATAAPSVAAVGSGVQQFDFERDPTEAPPSGFTTALTGEGRPGRWIVIETADAPSGRHVLVQTDADSTSHRFPVIVAQGTDIADVDLSVRFKTVSGEKDAAAGLVWRYRDSANYYVVRANAVEGNVVLYKVEDGRRTDLPIAGKGRTYGVHAKVAPRQWHTLQILAVGPTFAVSLDGVKLFDVHDRTFTAPGKVGMWTKSDSVAWFDDLTIRSAGQP